MSSIVQGGGKRRVVIFSRLRIIRQARCSGSLAIFADITVGVAAGLGSCDQLVDLGGCQIFAGPEIGIGRPVWSD